MRGGSGIAVICPGRSMTSMRGCFRRGFRGAMGGTGKNGMKMILNSIGLWF